MLNLFALTTVIASVISQEILGVNYSFDEDFNIYFNNKTCKSGDKWYSIDYQTLKIFTSNEQSHNGIIAANNSCVTSFPIVFFSDSVLELTAYGRITSLTSGLNATVYDELEALIVIYGYNKSSDNYTPGWNTLRIEINKNITGYLNLQGRVESNEIIIVDSFRYLVNLRKNNDDEVLWNSGQIDKTESLLLENLYSTNDIIDEFWSDDKESGSGDNNDLDGSGGNNDNDLDGSGGNNDNDLDGSGDSNDITSTTQSDINDLPDTPTPFRFWNPWTITLVTVGSFVIVSTMVITAYYIGKRRGQNDNAATIESLEPPRILRIPRVNSIYSGFRSNRRR